MRLIPIAALVFVAACARGEPPGADREATRTFAIRAAESTSAMPRVDPSGAAPVPGSLEDNLPFLPTGQRAASIAWRNWVYTDVGPKRTRYGYLRLGAVVDVRGPPIRNDGCEGGWYRVNPRGFVCMGLGATLDLANPASVASTRRPTRGEGLPYAYALSNETSPLLYFRLPSLREMRDSEQDDVAGRGAVMRERLRTSGLENVFPLGPPPSFLAGGARLPKPFGVKQPLRFVYHAGPADPDSGFALSQTFDWEGRPFGLTTELDIIALDRTKPVRPSDFHGVALGEGDDLPVGFSMPRGAERYERVGNQSLAKGTLGYREAVLLTGNERPGALLEAKDGTLVAKPTTRVVAKRTSFPSFATGDRKWLDVSIKDQTLVAYVGRRPVYVTLVSTGRSGLADPEETDATVRGSFMIYQKEVSSTMDGAEDKSDSFNLHDVPFVQYFHKGYALHGTYWHDEFGKARSHGCVNLAPTDAAWLFEWTDPSVPADWHGVLNKERGTVVYVRR
ncbi:MAG TPA: L,D-transpeptidase [Polyangiaceae bacterium]|nr:L,D-transpeptidase [Polyangiaceae bacterium]